MKKCINCGKEFESNDGRVKKCTNCRNKLRFFTPTYSREEFDKLYEESTLRDRKLMQKMQRINIIKTSIEYAFKLIVLGLLIVLLVK